MRLFFGLLCLAAATAQQQLAVDIDIQAASVPDAMLTSFGSVAGGIIGSQLGNPALSKLSMSTIPSETEGIVTVRAIFENADAATIAAFEPQIGALLTDLEGQYGPMIGSLLGGVFKGWRGVVLGEAPAAAAAAPAAAAAGDSGCADDPDGKLPTGVTCAVLKGLGCNNDVALMMGLPAGTFVKTLCPNTCDACDQTEPVASEPAAEPAAAGCPDDADGAIAAAGASCAMLKTMGGCDLDLSTMSPEAKKGTWLKCACPVSCGLQCADVADQCAHLTEVDMEAPAEQPVMDGPPGSSGPPSLEGPPGSFSAPPGAPAGPPAMAGDGPMGGSPPETVVTVGDRPEMPKIMDEGVVFGAPAIEMKPPVPGQDAPLVGNTRDEHGCIPSAGYSWCEALEKCHRPWEEECVAAVAAPAATGPTDTCPKQAFNIRSAKFQAVCVTVATVGKGAKAVEKAVLRPCNKKTAGQSFVVVDNRLHHADDLSKCVGNQLKIVPCEDAAATLAISEHNTFAHKLGLTAGKCANAKGKKLLNMVKCRKALVQGFVFVPVL